MMKEFASKYSREKSRERNGHDHVIVHEGPLFLLFLIHI